MGVDDWPGKGVVGLGPSWGVLVGVFAAGVGGLGVLAGGVGRGVDRAVQGWVVGHRVGVVTGAFEGVTWLGANAVVLPVLVAFGVYLVWGRRDVATALFVLAVYGGAVVLYGVGKVWVGRARPPVAQMVVRTGGYAFPSGHATQAMTAWGLIAVVALAGGSRAGRWIAWGCAGVVAMVGLSRVYLGVHWLTDVLGGWLLGLTWLALALGARRLWGGRPAPVRERATVEGESGDPR